MIMRAAFCKAVLVDFACHIRGSHTSALMKPFSQKLSFATSKQTKEKKTKTTKTKTKTKTKELITKSDDPIVILPLPAMVQQLSSSSGQARMDTLASLVSRAYGDETALMNSFFSANLDGDSQDDETLTNFFALMKTMSSEELGLLPILVEIAVSTDGGGMTTRERALELLFVISSGTTSNFKYMLSPELGLVPVLVSILTSDLCECRDESYFFAMVTLANMLTTHQLFYSPYSIGSTELGMLPNLMGVIDSCSKDNTIYAVLRIFAAVASREPENRVYMGSEELGLLKYLTTGILLSSQSDDDDDDDDDDDRRFCSIAFHILDCLAQEPKNRLFMRSEALGLVSALKKPALHRYRFSIRILRMRIYAYHPDVVPRKPTLLPPPGEPTTTEPPTTTTAAAAAAASATDTAATVQPTTTLLLTEPAPPVTTLLCTTTTDTKSILLPPEEPTTTSATDIAATVQPTLLTEPAPLEPPVTDTTTTVQALILTQPTTSIQPPVTDTATANTAIVHTPIIEPPITAAAVTFTKPTLLDPTTSAEIWALISEDPSKAVDPEKLAALLFELGLSRADELGYCDSAMWEDLAAHLKPIPKRKLLHVLAKNNISVGKQPSCLLIDR